MTKQCTGYASIPPHEADEAQFTKGKTRCRSCTSAYFKAWAARKRAQGQPAPAVETAADILTVDSKPAKQRQVVTAPTDSPPQEMSHDIGHTYRPDPKLVAVWDAIVAAAEEGEHLVLAMHGPQGSGKTDGAEFLAKRAGRPLVKIDAKSVIDAEAWFGTRGAVEGSTFYAPSEFVKAIQMRSVVYIDEYTRDSNEVRDVLNPLLDGTRTVLNPITGERIKVHPECIIMLGGNVGFKHTGTFDVDPATTSRLTVVNVGYPNAEDEKAILIEHANIDPDMADKLVGFAGETRINPQLPGVSTRELVQAAVLIKRGLDPTLAIEAKVIAAASDQGDEQSQRARLSALWGGYINPESAPATEGAGGTGDCVSCGAHGQTEFTTCDKCGAWVGARS